MPELQLLPTPAVSDPFVQSWRELVEIAPIPSEEKARLLAWQEERQAAREAWQRESIARSEALKRELTEKYLRRLAQQQKQQGKKNRARPVVAPSERLLVTVPEAAALLSMSRASVYRLMDAGDLASQKIGGKRRIAVQSLARYVEQNTP